MQDSKRITVARPYLTRNFHWKGI